jgi:hypothetical protein
MQTFSSRQRKLRSVRLLPSFFVYSLEPNHLRTSAGLLTSVHLGDLAHRVGNKLQPGHRESLPHSSREVLDFGSGKESSVKIFKNRFQLGILLKLSKCSPVRGGREVWQRHLA